MHWLRGRINRISSVLTRGIFPHEFSWVIDNPVRRLFVSPEQLVNRLPLPESSRLLEIGPESGYFSVELGRRAGTGRLELFDVQVEMLAKARRKLEARALFNVRYVQGTQASVCPTAKASSTWLLWSRCWERLPTISPVWSLFAVSCAQEVFWRSTSIFPIRIS